jgi:hypothetical protein
MQGRTAIVALLGCGLASAAAVVRWPAYAQQFSAEIVTRNAAGEALGPPARLSVRDHKVRIETPDLPGSVLIVDSDAPSAYLVRPAVRLFMDAKQSSPLTQFFVPLDPDDPCRQWDTMADIAGLTENERWRCQAQDRAEIDRRNTLKFAMTSVRGRSTGWIDTQLKFPVRIETENGAVFALRNIAEEPQSADKFEIPSDYKKFDPHQIIELLKHTDIWVPPQ